MQYNSQQNTDTSYTAENTQEPLAYIIAYSHSIVITVIITGSLVLALSEERV